MKIEVRIGDAVVATIEVPYNGQLGASVVVSEYTDKPRARVIVDERAPLKLEPEDLSDYPQPR